MWWQEQIKNINKISYIPTYEDELMYKAYQTYRYFPLLKHRAVYFPPSAQQMGRPFSPERETFCIFLLISFSMLAFFKENIPLPLEIFG